MAVMLGEVITAAAALNFRRAIHRPNQSQAVRRDPVALVCILRDQDERQPVNA